MNFADLVINLLHAVYVHKLDPFALQLTATSGIRWYGLSYLAGFFCAYGIILSLSKRGKIRLPESKVSDFIFYAAVGAILGGRLGYCFFYDTNLLTKVSSSFPFWGVLEVHHGGMASHGGILGVMIACLLFAKREALPKLELFDLVALTACLGIMFGRMANFVNAELVGRPVNESFAFAVKFPQDLLGGHFAPGKGISDLAAIAPQLGFSDNQIQQALRSQSPYFFETVANKAISQIQNGNVAVSEAVSPLLISRHPSQLYEAFLEGFLLFIIILIARRFWKNEGVASSTFLIIYPVLRILAEQFRMPDAQIGFELFGLTRGQWISVAMLLIGVCYSCLVLRKNSN